MNAATTEEIVDSLILARLLVPATRPPTPAAVRKALATLFTNRMSSSEWNDLFAASLARLVDSGLVTGKPLGLTGKGRESALARWEIRQLPQKIGWAALRNQYLVPHVLGFSRQDSGPKLTATGLVAQVLKARNRLPAEVAATAKAVITALAWKELNIDSSAPFTPQGVVGRRRLNSTRAASASDVAKQLARIELETAGNDLFLGALRQWIAGGPDGADHDPRQFAECVRRAATRSSLGRFGDDKVFIAHVWRGFSGMFPRNAVPLDEFKSRLVEAHRAGLLELSRADLVERMNPEDVAESETKYLDARFHFVRLDPETDL